MTDSAAAASQPAPMEQFLGILAGYIRYQAFHAAAELEVAEHLAGGPLNVDELATRTNAQPKRLFRLLRALETSGIFEQVSPRVFANTPVTGLLRKGVPGSLRAYLQAVSHGGGIYESWAGLAGSIRTGNSAFEQVHGCTVWEYLQRNPKTAAIFDEFMRNAQASMAAAVTAAYDWSRFPVIADIGGGNGGQLEEILKAHPSCRGILFDRPDVIARAIPHDRVERVGGSFFEREPSGADAYIMRSVIHDWSDTESVAILKTIRSVANSHTRVMLIEHILPETPPYAFSTWSDVAMMLAGGQERTKTEYGELLEQAGFELEQIVPTPTGIGLIISRPRA
jgi:O-methyltransferase domain